jgi:hypothetical protein
MRVSIAPFWGVLTALGSICSHPTVVIERTYSNRTFQVKLRFAELLREKPADYFILGLAAGNTSLFNSDSRFSKSNF